MTPGNEGISPADDTGKPIPGEDDGAPWRRTEKGETNEPSAPTRNTPPAAAEVPSDSNRAARPLHWIVGILLAIALIGAVELLIGWKTIWLTWREVSPRDLLLPIMLTVTSYSLRAARLAQVAASAGLRASFFSWFRMTAIHVLAVNVIPARGGEMALPILLHRHFKLHLGPGIGLLANIRLHDIAAMAGLGIAAVITLMFGPLAGSLALLIGGLSGWLGLLLLPRLILPWLDRAPPRIAALAWPLHRLPQRAGRVYLLTLGAWTTKWLALALIAGTVAALEPAQALVAIGAAEVAALSPIQGVAGAGSFEAAVAGALVLVGLSADAALHAAIQLHLFLLGMSLLLAGIAALIPHRRAGE